MTEPEFDRTLIAHTLIRQTGVFAISSNASNPPSSKHEPPSPNR